MEYKDRIVFREEQVELDLELMRASMTFECRCGFLTEDPCAYPRHPGLYRSCLRDACYVQQLPEQKHTSHA